MNSMINRALSALLLATFVFQPAHSLFANETANNENHSIGKRIKNTRIKDINGTEVDLFHTDSDFTVVVFMGWECPLVRQYVPELKTLRDRWSKKNVRWLAINSNQHDSLTELQYFARKFDFDLPMLKDVGNQLADQFGAQRTPEAFLLNKQQEIIYQGRIDDKFTYGRQREKAVSEFLATAIQQAVNQKTIDPPYVEPDGCIIGRVFKANDEDSSNAVTYSNQISRILQRNCTQCHRPGEIGPFSLSDYDEVVGWAGMIQEVVNERRMPPWHASPEHGSFSNDCRLSEDEIRMINDWVDAGAPQGDTAQLPEPVVYTTGWQMEKPDLVLPMDSKPYRVPATGTVDYEYFVVDPGFKEDKWVSAAECRPGNPAVIHHIIVGIAGEGQFRRRRGPSQHADVDSDWLVANAPGSPPMELPPGYGKLIRAGSKLIFQMHYTPNGKATTDISSVGLKFIDASDVTHRVSTLRAANRRFSIPPNEPNHRVTANFDFKQDAELFSLFPHMHLRGKSFRYTAHYPDSKSEILLDVPAYDFNWQNAYHLNEPKLIPKGTRIHCVARFDNSEDNFANPDPNQTIRWGDQTWEEMMIGYFNVAQPIEMKPQPE